MHKNGDCKWLYGTSLEEVWDCMVPMKMYVAVKDVKVFIGMYTDV